MAGVFDGIRILDFTQDTAGPFAGMLLAEQGADVIKVEPPEGDRARGKPGFYVVNRSKRGIVLDLSSESDRREAQALAAKADVVLVDGLQAQAAERGIDYASLAAVNPRLVYCSIPLYGSKGPYAGLPPDDNMVAALGCVYGNQFSYSGSPVFFVTPFVPMPRRFSSPAPSRRLSARGLARVAATSSKSPGSPALSRSTRPAS